MSRRSRGTDRDELLACAAVFCVAAFAASVWVTGGLAAVLSGRRWPELPLRDGLALAVRVVLHAHDPALAWPTSDRADEPAIWLWYVVFVTLWIIVTAAVLGLRASTRRWQARRRQGASVSRRAAPTTGTRRPQGAKPSRSRSTVVDHASSGWATPGRLGSLAVPRPGDGRLVLGRVARRLVAAERGHSLLLVGPTQSGKTSGLVIPAIIEWEGPVLATSVKTDIVRATKEARARTGNVQVFDPASVTGMISAGWSPLAQASTWEGARKVAAALCSVARPGSAGLDDAAFWYAMAEKLIAPLLFAAKCSDRSIVDVVRWVDTGEIHEVIGVLDDIGDEGAIRAAQASFSREERQRSSVYSTAEAVLAAYGDPVVATSCVRHDLDPASLLAGGRDTVHLVAPAHDQARLEPIFVAIIRSYIEEAMTRSSRLGAPLDPPLLVVLDEAANIAPVSTLDVLASIAASHGVQLLTVWQDLAQVEARYGSRAATVVNNHRAKVLCSGITDAGTLEMASRLIGDEDRTVDSTTIDHVGATSTTRSVVQRRLAPLEQLRCLAPGTAVLLYGHLPPVKLALRPYFEVRRVRRRSRRVVDGPVVDGSVVDERSNEQRDSGGAQRRGEDAPAGNPRQALERHESRNGVAGIGEGASFDPAAQALPRR